MADSILRSPSWPLHSLPRSLLCATGRARDSAHDAIRQVRRCGCRVTRDIRRSRYIRRIRIYTSQLGSGCANCHEMADYVAAVHGSNHRNVSCQDCHTATLSTKLRHIRVHLTRSWPEEIRLRDVDVVRMTKNCQQCHQQEYATWHAGPHSATYSRDIYEQCAKTPSNI